MSDDKPEPRIRPCAGPHKEALLERAAHRVSAEESFLGFVMARWCGGALDLDKVAAFLGCTREVATRLSLCRTPEPDSAYRASDWLRLADYAGVSVSLLKRLASVSEAPIQPSARARRATEAVADDLFADTSLLGAAWRQTDSNIRREIEDKWAQLVEKAFTGK